MELEKIKAMNADELKTMLRIAERQIREGLQKAAWDKIQIWFNVIDAVLETPAYQQISTQEREQLAKAITSAVKMVSYNVLEPKRLVVEGITLVRDITIRGKPYKAGYYKVPKEMEQSLALWLVDKGFAKVSGFEAA